MPYKGLLYTVIRVGDIFRARMWLRSPKNLTPTKQAVEHNDLETMRDEMRSRGMVPCLDKPAQDSPEVVEVWVKGDRSAAMPKGFIGEYAGSPRLDPINERQTVREGTRQALQTALEASPSLPVETVSGILNPPPPIHADGPSTA